MLKHRIQNFLKVVLIWLMNFSYSWGASNSSATTDDPLTTTNDFSVKMLGVIQGPILKLLAATVLLVGVAGLLRGRHKLAISCGLAFLLLLFLPILLSHVAN